MEPLSSGRRSLIGLIVSLTAAFACVGQLACSSSGSSFDMGGASSSGSGSTTTNNPTAATGGNGVTDPTNTTGGGSAPSYGVHLRLRADYPIATLSPGAQVVARAMQNYGMYHADGGEIPLTAQGDRHTVAKWNGLLDSHDLAALKVTDFEVVDHGPQVALTNDCVR